MKTHDGGPAFPTTPDETTPGHYGMSLLDWFAGQVAQAVQPGFSVDRDGTFEFPVTEAQNAALAKHCYDFAAAMLTEKERRAAEVPTR